MAYPNLLVATRLFAVTNDGQWTTYGMDKKPRSGTVKGSNFRVERITRTQAERMRALTEGVFVPLTQAFSYETPIALNVFNTHAQCIELWLTHTTYSPTTRRHISDVQQALSAFTRSEYCKAGPPPCVYRTDALDLYGDRVTDSGARWRAVQAAVRSAVRFAAQPRCHYIVIDRRLRAARSVLRAARTTMTHNVPEAWVARTCAQRIEMLDRDLALLDSLIDTPREAVKVAARGIVALEGETK